MRLRNDCRSASLKFCNVILPSLKWRANTDLLIISAARDYDYDIVREPIDSVDVPLILNRHCDLKIVTSILKLYYIEHSERANESLKTIFPPNY